MRTAVAAAALLLVVGLRFAAALAFPAPLGDELAYDRAFTATAEGASPYIEPGFLYPPIFARVGAWLRWGGPMAPLYGLRAANALGLVSLVWLSSGWLGWGWRGRLASAAAVVLLSPAVYQGMTLGNVSFLVSGLIVGALSAWPRRPVGSGLSLALSLAIKPLAPAAILSLGAHQATAGGSRHRLAAAVAICGGAVAFLATPGLGAFLERGSRSAVLASTVSPYRFVILTGVAVSPLWLTLAVHAALIWLVRRRPLSPAELTATAVVGCIAATPMVWNHTLLLTLPVQAMAFASARRAQPRRGARFEFVLVVLAIVTLHLAEGATGITDRSWVLQAMAALPPVLAPGLLLGYVLRRGDYAR